MRISLDLPDYQEIVRDVRTDVATVTSEAMRATTYKTLLDLRRSTTGAGLSQRLANTWRDRVYPERRSSMTPTGYIWSNAPEIIDSLSRGATIYPRGGQRFLAIPTDKVPFARRSGFGGRRVKSGRMTPTEVERAFGQDLFFLKGKNGNQLAFLNLIRGKRANRPSFRPASGRRLQQGRGVERVLMFVLVPKVDMPKLFNLDRVATEWADRYGAQLTRRLGG